MRVATLAVISLALAVAFVPAVPATPPALWPIQPGGPLSEFVFPAGVETAHCTLGFILRDAVGTWYALTAAHCVPWVGAKPYITSAGGYYGTTVVDDDLPSQGGPAAGIDVALIRIDAGKVAYISPAVRGYGGPTGVASTASAAMGDTILLTGYNNGVGHGYPASANQVQYVQHGGGVLSQFDGPNYRSIDSSVDGYSGGPVIMGDDGEALGLVSVTVAHFQVGLPSVDAGPTVSSALARLSSVYGYTLTLQTAPFTGVPPV